MACATNYAHARLLFHKSMAYGTPIDTAGAIDEFYFINTAVQELEETFFQTDYLATMQNIDVSHNHFAKLPERMFGWYDNDVLTDFDVSTNRITAVAPTTFAGFGAVEALNVANNLLESLPVDIFRGMHALKRLNLNNNLLTELPGGIFQGLEKIETLLMQTNRFDRLASDVFAGLTPLTAITMASSRPLSCTDSLLERDADSGSITELKCDCIVTRSKLEGKKDRRDLNEDSDSNDNVNTPPSQKSIAVTETTFNYPHGDYLAYCMTAAEIASFYTPLTTPPWFRPAAQYGRNRWVGRGLEHDRPRRRAGQVPCGRHGGARDGGVVRHLRHIGRVIACSRHRSVAVHARFEI